MGILKQLFGSGKTNNSCCDVKITEVKDQQTNAGNKAAPAAGSSSSASGGQSCCSK
jgi:hypothetical protein